MVAIGLQRNVPKLSDSLFNDPLFVNDPVRIAYQTDVSNFYGVSIQRRVPHKGGGPETEPAGQQIGRKAEVVVGVSRMERSHA